MGINSGFKGLNCKNRHTFTQDIIQGNVITDLSPGTKTYACKVREMVRHVQVADLSRQTTWDRTDERMCETYRIS